VTGGYLHALRLFSRDVRLFLVSAGLVGLAWDGMRAVLFNLYLLRLGYGPEFVGLANAAGALAFALLCPIAGALGTRWGSRNVLIAGLGLMAGGFGLIPMAEFLPVAWRSGWLLAGAVAGYGGMSLYLVNGLPFTMGTTGPEERTHVFSVHVALIPLAAFAGSLIGGALPGAFARLLGMSAEHPSTYGYPMWLASLLLLPGMVALLPTRPADGARAPSPAGSSQAQLPADGRPTLPGGRPPYELIVIIALIMALRFGARGSSMTFFNVYLDDRLGLSTALIGTLTAAGQLLAVPGALSAPLLVARLGITRTIAGGAIGMALCLVPLALIPNWAVAGLSFMGSSALFSITTGPIRVYSQELVAPRWRAIMASAFMMGPGLAYAVLSLAGGYIITGLGYPALFLLGAGLAVAGAILFWIHFRVPRGEFARNSAPEMGD
jgi:MFS family permease